MVGSCSLHLVFLRCMRPPSLLVCLSVPSRYACRATPSLANDGALTHSSVGPSLLQHSPPPLQPPPPPLRRPPPPTTVASSAPHIGGSFPDPGVPLPTLTLLPAPRPPPPHPGGAPPSNTGVLPHKELSTPSDPMAMVLPAPSSLLSPMLQLHLSLVSGASEICCS